MNVSHYRVEKELRVGEKLIRHAVEGPDLQKVLAGLRSACASQENLDRYLEAEAIRTKVEALSK